MPTILCPLCRGALQREIATWRCARNHSFDVAREGYVNLLPVQHKNSRDPGDDPQMVLARREFLQAGHYQPLRDAAVALLVPLKLRELLDIGCGEGYYTAALMPVATEVSGLDISRPAIRLAARRFPGITWLVGTGALLPFEDASHDGIANIFTQMHVSEMRRVLRPEGHLLLVVPAADHLQGLREQLFEDVRPHDPDKFLGPLGPAFELQARRELRFALDLDRTALGHLLQMTPYAWKARPERRAALEARDTFQTEAAFSLMLFRRSASDG